MKNYFLAICILILSLTFWSCGGEKIPDVSKIQVDIHFLRFDQDLEALKKEGITWSGLQNLKKKYPDFAPIYFESIVRAGSLADSSTLAYIKDFLTNADINELHQDVDSQFTDLTPFKEEVTQAFKFYRYYFPQRQIPQVLTYNYGFNYKVVAIDSAICIALDQYLGKKSLYYAHLPEYIAYRNEKAYMTTNLMKGWIESEFESPQPRTDMLDEMIYQGKMMYALDKVLPHAHDSILMGYTKGQLTFCNRNEYMIWSYFLENKLLYSKDFTLIAKYCGEAPFSAGMPKESPGRTGVWIGWKIVTAFMKKNKEITLEQLLTNHNYKQIFNGSKYKPKK